MLVTQFYIYFLIAGECWPEAHLCPLETFRSPSPLDCWPTLWLVAMPSLGALVALASLCPSFEGKWRVSVMGLW